MRWLSILLCATLAGCAANGSGIHLTGERYGVAFSVDQSAEGVRIECEPPSVSVPAGWVDECNAVAQRYLGSMVADGTILDFPEPPFGQASQAVRKIWDGLAGNSGSVDVASMRLSREMAWAELK